MMIGVLIPAYNEEKNIRAVIREIKQALPNVKIVVVDDGSTDRTAELAEMEGPRVLRHQRNMGKAEAIKTGFEHFLRLARIRWVVLMDADRQYNAGECARLLEPLKRGEADFVMGYRDWRQVPFRHWLGNLVWRKAFNSLFGTGLRDTNCGYMAMTKDAMEVLKDIYGGYIIENSLLVNALRGGLRIIQVPVSVEYKEKRDVLSGVRMVLGILVFILREGIKFRVLRWLGRR
jgi:glycosyltransferase involved in cell wall biosynthesis